MQFKVPPGGLAVASALWILLGGFLSYSSFAAGDNYFGVGGLIFCVAGFLIWFDMRAVAWPLMIWFSFVILCALLLLIFKGLTMRPFAGIAMAGYTIYELNQWRQSE